VAGWTAKKGIDVFTKDIIMMPVHGGNHWPLCCIMNAEYITANHDLSPVDLQCIPVPCIICFDSMQGIHNYTMIAKTVLLWLKQEYSKKHKTSGVMFNSMNTPLIIPKGNFMLMCVCVCVHVFGITMILILLIIFFYCSISAD
jgi:Ulp1 family protease